MEDNNTSEPELTLANRSWPTYGEAQNTVEAYHRFDAIETGLSDIEGDLWDIQGDFGSRHHVQDAIDEVRSRVTSLVTENELLLAVDRLIQHEIADWETAPDRNEIGEDEHAWYLIVGKDEFTSLSVNPDLAARVASSHYEPEVRDAWNRNPQLSDLAHDDELPTDEGFPLVLYK